MPIHWEAIGRACSSSGSFEATDVLTTCCAVLRLAAQRFLEGAARSSNGQLRPLTSPCFQQGVHLTTRAEAAHFVSVSCRRYAFKYMRDAELPTRGSITVGTSGLSDEAQILPSRAKLARISDQSPTQWNALMTNLQRLFSDNPRIDTKLEFNFIGEEGTGEGPTQEFYSELSRWFHLQPQLWCTAADGLPEAKSIPSLQNEITKDMYVLGYATARAFVDNYSMSISLDPVFWQILVQLHRERFNANAATATSLPAIVASWVNRPYYKTMMDLRDLSGDDLDNLCLTMDDEETPVTPTNVHAFVNAKLVAMTGVLTKNMLAFLEGFSEVLDPELLQLFQATEAATVFGGTFVPDQPLFTQEELRQAVCGGHGYTTDSAVVKRLCKWQANCPL